MTAAYPGEPWRLRGDLHASVFLVSLDRVPADMPPGWRPVRLCGRGVVGAAWVDYRPGGVLSYRELMATLLVRRGMRVLPTIVRIWVDSPASRDGGRALWGIPKQLASFDLTAGCSATSLSARDEDGLLARGRVRSRLRLPGRWPVRFAVVQRLAGSAKVSPVRTRAAIGLSAARFDAEPDGPIRFLAGRRPVISFSLHDFRMTFGG